jgi:hypothetical protein
LLGGQNAVLDMARTGEKPRFRASASPAYRS